MFAFRRHCGASPTEPLAQHPHSDAPATPPIASPSDSWSWLGIQSPNSLLSAQDAVATRGDNRLLLPAVEVTSLHSSPSGDTVMTFDWLADWSMLSAPGETPASQQTQQRDKGNLGTKRPVVLNSMDSIPSATSFEEILLASGLLSRSPSRKPPHPLKLAKQKLNDAEDEGASSCPLEAALAAPLTATSSSSSPVDSSGATATAGRFSCHDAHKEAREGRCEFQRETVLLEWLSAGHVMKSGMRLAVGVPSLWVSRTMLSLMYSAGGGSSCGCACACGGGARAYVECPKDASELNSQVAGPSPAIASAQQGNISAKSVLARCVQHMWAAVCEDVLHHWYPQLLLVMGDRSKSAKLRRQRHRRQRVRASAVSSASRGDDGAHDGSSAFITAQRAEGWAVMGPIEILTDAVAHAVETALICLL